MPVLRMPVCECPCLSFPIGGTCPTATKLPRLACGVNANPIQPESVDHRSTRSLPWMAWPGSFHQGWNCLRYGAAPFVLHRVAERPRTNHPHQPPPQIPALPLDNPAHRNMIWLNSPATGRPPGFDPESRSKICFRRAELQGRASGIGPQGFRRGRRLDAAKRFDPNSDPAPERSSFTVWWTPCTPTNCRLFAPATVSTRPPPCPRPLMKWRR